MNVFVVAQTVPCKKRDNIINTWALENWASKSLLIFKNKKNAKTTNIHAFNKSLLSLK